MRPALRTQADNLQDFYSLEAAQLLDEEPHGEDRTRQELKIDTDVNDMLRRFGVNVPQKTPVFGKEVNFDLDLQQALGAIDQAKEAYKTMPNDLQRRYPTWQRFLNAIERGDLTLHQTDPEQQNVPPQQVSLSASEPKKP